MGYLTGRRELFTPLDEEELTSFHRNPIVLLLASPVEMYCAWNGTGAIDRGEKMGVLVWRPLVSLIFLKRSLVFPILLFSSISLH